MKTNRGFTLIELLIVIAIISLLASTLLPRLGSARAKADDARRKATLKSLQSQIVLQADAGVSGYSNIFSTTGDTKSKLDELVAQTGISGSDYDAVSDANSYAIVFPLKANPTKYWCVDASGTSKQVNGRLNVSGSPSCDNISAIYSGTTDLAISMSPNPVVLRNINNSTGLTVSLTEIGNNPTSGTITVRVTKPSGYSATLDASSSTDWSLNTTNPSYWLFTSNSGVIIGAESSKTINITFTKTSSSNGLGSISAILPAASGGDTNSSNNNTSVLLDSQMDAQLKIPVITSPVAFVQNVDVPYSYVINETRGISTSGTITLRIQRTFINFYGVTFITTLSSNSSSEWNITDDGVSDIVITSKPGVVIPASGSKTVNVLFKMTSAPVGASSSLYNEVSLPGEIFGSFTSVSF